MTDRELLEMAAKAAGLKNLGWFKNEISGREYPVLGHVTKPWNPLEDDGDALRLAMFLDFGIEVHQALAMVRVGNGEQENVTVHWNLKNIPDVGTATRRAIVRAAAEIGKAMP